MTDLFSQTTGTTEHTIENAYETLVGEGKKFKTNEDLAKGKVEADRFIAQLQGELEGIRKELSTRQTLEQLMDKITAKETPNPNLQGQHQTPQEGEGNQKTLTSEDIDKLLDSRLREVEKARLHNSNLETVKNALIQSFGSDFATHLKAKAAELGVSEEYMQNMAKETPKAFLKLVEADKPSEATHVANKLFSPPTGVSMAPTNASKGFSPSGVPKQSFYENIRRTDPNKYWSAEVQNKMHKDAIALGEAFFDI